MKLDVHSREPLYAQISDHLESQIASGALAAGAQLPSEDSLVERFGISRTTVRSAIQALVREGLVEIRRGKGTFVSQPTIVQELTQFTGFVEDMETLGRTASARVLDAGPVAADALIAERLEVPEGSLVVRIRRVRLADGVPVLADESYLPKDLGDKVLSADLECEPIFALLENKFQTPLIEAEYRLQATAASPQIAQALEIEPGSPIFLIERTSYSLGRRPVDFERLYYRGDHIRFVTRLARRAGTRTSEDGA